MKLTSKEANKLLRQLEADKLALLSKEKQSSTFLASVGEDVESCRPKYDYEKSQENIDDLNNKIIKLKHAINVFNTKTIVDGTDKTIDEVLVYLPQLSIKKAKLSRMVEALPKTREAMNMRSTIIDYRYTNYDNNVVKKDFEKICYELDKVQVALDTTNVTKTFEFNF